MLDSLLDGVRADGRARWLADALAGGRAFCQESGWGGLAGCWQFSARTRLSELLNSGTTGCGWEEWEERQL